MYILYQSFSTMGILCEDYKPADVEKHASCVKTCECRRNRNRSTHNHTTNMRVKRNPNTLKLQKNQSTPHTGSVNQSGAFGMSAANGILFVFLHILLIGQSESNYDLCTNSTNFDAIVCQPRLVDAALSPSASVVIDPVSGTCGNPVSTWKRLGDRSNTVYTCNANDPNLSHPPSYMLNPSPTTWWQSVNQVPGAGDLKINADLSFNKMFRLSGDIIITFHSGRPNLMILERSKDFGATWQPWQYYARNCSIFATETAGATITKATPAAVICTNNYIETRVQTAPGRKVEFKTQQERFDLFLEPAPNLYEGIYTAIDTQLMDFLLFTNIRIRLLEPATDGRGNWDMYHYGISRVQVVARCYCNLHAGSCNYTGTEVACNCEHNTQGQDCQECLPLYNNRPWKRGSFLPYPDGTANECTKCECYDHAISCTYNATYGSGICDVCLHNTRGNHCQLCALGFFANDTAPLTSIDRCLACNCEPIGVTDLSLPCDQSLTPGVIHGQCPCKTGIAGRRCDECLPTFYGLFLPPVGTCNPCACNLDGTVGQSNVCSQTDGQCPCKPSTTGRACDTCGDGFYAFPTGSPSRGCFPCNCDQGGSLNQVCDKTTGRCQCRTGISGDKCDRTQTGVYVPAIDYVTLQPLNPQASGTCSVTSDLWTVNAPFDGKVFAVCPALTATDTVMEFEAIGRVMQLALEWPSYMAIRYSSLAADINGTLTVRVTGNTQVDLSTMAARLGQAIPPGCPVAVGNVATVGPISFPSGTSKAVVVDHLVPLDVRCQYSFSLSVIKVTPPTPGARKKRELRPTADDIFIDSLVLFPALSNTDGSVVYQLYADSINKNQTVATYLDCLKMAADLKVQPTSVCNDMFFSLVSELMNGALPCGCDTTGSLTTTTCQSLGGQCSCKVGVSGRACDMCLPGYYNFTTNGCNPCNCYSTGSENGACDVTTGQCPCLTNVAQLTTSVPGVNGQPATTPYDGTCSKCLPDYYGIDTGLGCTACGCNADGSQTLQCDAQGNCPCKDSVNGTKCDTCKEQYYGFGPQGCSMCNCSDAGSQSLNCDLQTGLCTCKTNVQGDKCDQCKSNFFNILMEDPNGCQPCFCFNHGTDCTSATGFQLALISTSTPQNGDFSMFLGDRHTSFGRLITLDMTSAFSLDLINRVILTLESNNKKLQHVSSNTTALTRGQPLRYTIQLWEENWFYVDATLTQPATAANMYEILATLDEVRPITSAFGQTITVTYLSMETAVLEGAPLPDPSVTLMSEVNVTFVEECTCIPANNVGGLSCEECATGNRRANPATATSYDTCVACNCNNRGATTPPECDQMTGICLNCRNGTTGDQCESCAANVTGAECDTCVQEYWGLSVNGCAPCECSSPGSVNTVCDVITGQCECVPFVTGRTCDQCQENYHTLTATGCSKCDSCYDEVATAIVPLRTLRDDAKSNVSLAETQDTTAVNGLFVDRLAAAQADTAKLVNFLNSAIASETQVLQDINSLNSTLLNILDQLSLLEQNTSAEIETLLVDIENSLNKANTERVSMEAYTKNAYTNMATLTPLNTQLSALVTSLSTVEQYLQSQADASTADQKLLQDLSRLNDTAFQANLLANQLSADASTYLTTHQNTTSRLLSLESTVLRVSNRVLDVEAQASALSVSTASLQQRVARLQTELAQIMNYRVDLTPYDARMASARAKTSSLKSQLLAEMSLFSPVNIAALSSNETTEALANQTMNITGTSSEWLRRSKLAEQEALMYESQGSYVFSEARRALTTVQSFSGLSQDAKNRANLALVQVASIHNASVALINQSNALSASISSLQQIASSAKVSSQEALRIIKDKQQQLQGALIQADQLEIRLNAHTDLSSERYSNLNNLQDNILTPAVTQLETVQGELQTYDGILASADSVTTQALTDTASVQERANQLLIQLRDLRTVNTTVAQQRLDEVRTSAANTNVGGLRAAAQDLQTAVSIQQAEIDRMTAQKEALKTRVQNLQALVDQLNL